MMTLLQAIGDVVRPEFRRDGVIRLEEADPQSTCGPVTLNKRGLALVLKLDSLPPPACAQPGCQIRCSVNDRLFPLFRQEMSGLTALCDYLIFYPEPSGDAARLFVFLCELKSTNIGSAKKQAENGKLLADYVVAMAKHHRKLPSIPSIETRGIVFSPVLEQPKIADPRRDRCDYRSHPGALPDMKFAYCRAGASYPLEYFCA